MNTAGSLVDATRDSARTPLAGRATLALLGRITRGSLTVRLPHGGAQWFGRHEAGEPHAAISLTDWTPCAAALRSGDVGFGESFMAGRWSTPDLPALLSLLRCNRDALEDAIGRSWTARLLGRLHRASTRNTRRGSRRNIEAHYDLGNAFYALWLDETMTYSSGLWAGDSGRSLAEAQRAKLRRALDAAGVGPGTRLLEVGCGWGSLADLAVRERGATVTGLTLSREQLAYSKARFEPAHPDRHPRPEFRLQDYRDLDGAFDAICSIEMIEAVGRAWWPAYFASLHRALKPGGRACVQSIVIADARFERYARRGDFIRRHVFPGGFLPSPTAFRRAALAAGFEIEDEFAFGADYARTLALWRAAFLARRADVAALGLDEAFLRKWEFYLAYCETGFAHGDTDVVQYTLRKHGGDEG